MKHLVLLLLVLAVTSGFAQTGKVVGKVRDTAGEELIGAIVVYKKDVSIGSVADESGNYIIELPAGKCQLICRFTDMKTDTFEITVFENQTVQHDITLENISVTDLEEFEIKVGKFDTPFEDQTVSMEILKPKIIENKNTRSIETALDQTPGLNILDGEPQIRGGSGFTFGVGSKVAVIVDDMPMLSGDAGRPEWGFIPVENIHQIEVIKGAASVLSGSSALSGSIHIRTAYPTSKPLTKVNAYSGLYSKPDGQSANWYSGVPLISGINLLHSRKIKNWDVVLGGNLNYDHGYMGPPITGPLVIEDSVTKFSNKNMSSKRARVNFNLQHRSKKYKGLAYGVNGNFMYAETNMIFAWLDDTTGLYRAYPGAMFLQHQLIFNVDPFLTFYTATSGKHSFRSRMLRTVNDMSANQSNQSTVIYGNYEFQKKYSVLSGFEFIGGLTGTNTHSYSNIYVGSGNAINQLLNLSAYAQGEKKIKKTVNISVGGRLEYFQLNDSVTALKPIFRAGSSIKIYQETYLRLSYGQGYRFPTIAERFIKTGIGNFGVFPNPQLKPESSWNAEVGIKQGLKFGKLMGYLDVAAFWQEYENTIEYMFGIWDAASNTSFAGFKFLNTGKSRVLGLDVSFSGIAKAGKNHEITFMSGYNYIVPKTLNPDYVYAIDDFNRVFSYNSTSLDSASKILKYRFLHNVKADVEWAYKKKFAVGVSVKYFSKIVNMDRIIKEFEEFTASAPYIQNIRYMDYFNTHRFGNIIVDARISYSLNAKHKLALIGSNILNRSYSLRPLKIEPPRTIMLQYTYKLGGE
ncbi:MAG: TonB-dependent receptor [Flavobacteriia bacterium]|nr:TonB-dependent receptor [Flavobacteriia bacterium]